MGIRCYLIRASEEELQEKVLHPKATKDAVFGWPQSDHLELLDSTEAAAAARKQNEDKDSKPPAKKAKTETQETQDEAKKTLREARHLCLDKSWTAIHWLLTHQDGTTNGDAYSKADPVEPVTALLIDKKKFYEVSLFSTGERTRYGKITDLKPRAGVAVSGSFQSTSPPLAAACDTLKSKLAKGYKAHLVGLDTAVQKRYDRFGGAPSKKPAEGEQSTSLVDIYTVKDKGVKECLQDQFGMNQEDMGLNAKNRVETLFRSFVMDQLQPKHPDGTPYHLSYLVYGGEPTCFLAYGEGRCLNAKQLKHWNEEIVNAVDKGLKNVFDPEKMKSSDEFPAEWKADDWDYIETHILALRYFLQCAVEDEQGVLIYLA
ncbi:expressed unknown protein [Seminavis robusta]|uniref:DUF1877 family protein n=1 Tax=Seminavis robusta TaxID=568900 RepID=A0A9N8HGS6_9STRA|nr:expressed unknown protein [Seminavis robusta]|eukprot:Sro594_g172400.1 n/a (373) ;mRNA; r:11403-12521